MAYRDKKSTKIKGALIVAMIRVTYRLPAGFVRFLSSLAARLNLHLNGKTTRVMRRNLQLCFPQITSQELDRRLANNIQQNASLTHEFATAWLAGEKKISEQLKKEHGRALIDTAVEQSKPVIVAVPHIGNWEYFWHWLQFNYPLVGMYQPAKFSGVDQLVLNARSRFGGELFATDPKGIMGLLRALKKGKVMMILPDQAPREGAGVYSPFYGQSAYTMTLLHKFVQKTNAQLVFGSCIRNDDRSGFDIFVDSPDFDPNVESVEDFNRAMNTQLETLINRWPDQYQWSYKRFKRQPEGKNLYS